MRFFFDVRLLQLQSKSNSPPIHVQYKPNTNPIQNWWSVVFIMKLLFASALRESVAGPFLLRF